MSTQTDRVYSHAVLLLWDLINFPDACRPVSGIERELSANTTIMLRNSEAGLPLDA